MSTSLNPSSNVTSQPQVVPSDSHNDPMMASQAVRRSGRVRKPVKSYADEQAHQKSEFATKPEVTSRKRKATALDENEDSKGHKRQIISLDTSEDEIAAPPQAAKRGNKSTKKSQEKTANATTEPETKKPKPKSSQTQVSEPATKTKKAPKPKARRTSTDRSWHYEAAQRRIVATNSKIKRLAPGQQEYRLRAYVDYPPQSYHDFVKRANTQRMFILERERGIEESCHANHDDCPCEKVQIAGTTGNVYTVTISHLPSCTCPVGIFTRKGQEKLCKHALYVLHHVLKAPVSLKQQNAFLTSELRQIFDKAPPLPSEAVEEDEKDGNRKAIEDDCPICCMEFERDDEVVWCQSSCGNNLHKACFDQWARTKAHVTCPFCRADWEDAAFKPKTITKVDMPISVGGGGYRNVRDQLDYGE